MKYKILSARLLSPHGNVGGMTLLAPPFVWWSLGAGRACVLGHSSGSNHLWALWKRKAFYFTAVPTGALSGVSPRLSSLLAGRDKKLPVLLCGGNLSHRGKVGQVMQALCFWFLGYLGQGFNPVILYVWCSYAVWHQCISQWHWKKVNQITLHASMCTYVSAHGAGRSMFFLGHYSQCFSH